MDLAGFWALIARSAQKATDPIERGDWLAAALTGLADEDLIDFQDHLDAQTDRVGSWLMWHAASLIQGGCSDDGFSGFRAWLVGLGPVVVDRVADDPDRLADQPEVQRLAGRHSRTCVPADYRRATTAACRGRTLGSLRPGRVLSTAAATRRDVSTGRSIPGHARGRASLPHASEGGPRTTARRVRPNVGRLLPRSTAQDSVTNEHSRRSGWATSAAVRTTVESPRCGAVRSRGVLQAPRTGG
ncbi:DUF4240 domain-containing protein [Dactylosporangium maewongense]|uniref:DUF4240 domain-containing protein n=1 Tax=Dactylosporangium maewongense TaxID=634393 RepID=UPI003CD05ED5